MLCDPKSTFNYKSGGDCQTIWRKHGWTPPSEYRTDYLFKQNRGENHEEISISTRPSK